MNSTQLIELLEDADLDVFAYSGRGMYGAQCVAVRFGEHQNPIEELLNACAIIEDKDLRSAFANQTTAQDQLGLGSVVYWPRLTWPDENAA